MVLRGIPLWSEALGLSGRADVVEIGDNAIIPVEYKAGVRHGDAADLQLCAQAICLEEMLKVEVPEGYVWYGGPRRRERVSFTVAMRSEVRNIVAEIRERMVTGKLPEAANDERCNTCQLFNHCLPQLTQAPRKVRRYMDDIVFECAT